MNNKRFNINYFIKTMRDHGLERARILAYNKETHLRKNPKSRVLFNANVFTKHGKCWYGDLDLTADLDALQSVANNTGCDIYILEESNGRYFKNTDDIAPLVKKAVLTVSPKLIYKLINLFRNLKIKKHSNANDH